MAKAPAGTLPPVIHDLLRRPHRYSFTQAVRLLRLWAKPQSARELEALLRNRLRIRPALNLAFAVSDIDTLTVTFPGTPPAGAAPHAALPFEKARISATFLGLYGSSSPLPKFYTERLLEDQSEDSSVTRDFLDIFNNEFFLLHSILSSFIHPLYRRVASFDPKAGKMLMALASYGDTTLCDRLPDENTFLRYAGFFFQATRTATGLRAILADASGCANTAVHCNILRHAPIPEGQQFRLGLSAATLGEEATLGSSVPSYEGKILIEFRDLDDKTFRSMLPGTRLSGLLHTLIRNYCRQPLHYAVVARLSANETHALCLGGDEKGRFASLGHDSWAGFGGSAPSAPLPQVAATFSTGFKNNEA